MVAADLTVGGSAGVVLQPLTHVGSGGVTIGGSAPVVVQPLIYTPTGGVTVGGGGVYDTAANGGIIIFPTFTVSGTGYAGGNVGSLPFPNMSINGLGLGGTSPVTGDLLFPTFGMSGTGQLHVEGVGDIRPPIFSITGFGQIRRESLVFPNFSISGTGSIGAYGSGSLHLSVMSIAGMGGVGGLGYGVILFAGITVNGSAFVPATGSGSISFRTLRIAGKGSVGVLGSGSVDFPLFSVDGTAYLVIPGVGKVSFPIFHVAGYGTVDFQEVFKILSMNVNNMTVTEYDNYPFNSFCSLNDGRYLAAGANGIYLLGGDTDDGVNINASFETGISDFGSAYLKRLREARVGYRTSGGIKFKSVTGENTERVYEVPDEGRNGIHQRRTSVFRNGKGIKSKEWSVGVENMDGSDFDVTDIDLEMGELVRKSR